MNKTSNNKPRQQRNRNRQQPRKDSATKRINYDNAREDKVAKQIVKDAKSGKFNDINDFLKNPTLLKSAASYPAFPILGDKVGTSAAAPGIMTFYWSPNFGSYDIGNLQPFGDPTTSDASILLTTPPVALNQSADSTYSYLVHANSRNYAYNSPDLMLLIIAGSQVFSMIEAMKRAYGIAKNYVETNRYTPDSLLVAQGFNPTDLRHNLGQAWFDINNLIVQTRQIWVPNVFPIVTRWMDLNSNMYKDATGPYAQTYQYVQNTYFLYSETAYNTGGALIDSGFHPGLTNSTAVVSGSLADTSTPTTYLWSQWVGKCQEMIDALVNSEDRGIIYGDLLNAYTAERIIALPEISADYSVDAEYSPEISMQIENTVSLSYRLAPIGLVQFNNKLFPMYRKPMSSGSTEGAVKTLNIPTPNVPILNFHVESDPTPEMILLATRFQSFGISAVAQPLPGTTSNIATKAEYVYAPATSGSEIVTNITMCVLPVTASDADSNYSNNYWRMNGLWGLDLYTDAESMAFDWHPFIYNLDTGTVPTNYPEQPDEDTATIKMPYGFEVTKYYGDYDRYTISTHLLVDKINDVAFLSLFGVPQI